MAIARCENCGRPDGRGGNVYSTVPHYPLNHPNSGIVCGTGGCQNAPVVWLLEPEEAEYRNGRRVFKLTGENAMVKLHVQ